MKYDLCANNAINLLIRVPLDQVPVLLLLVIGTNVSGAGLTTESFR